MAGGGAGPGGLCHRRPPASSSTRPSPDGRHLAGLHTVFYYLGLLKALGGVDTFTPPTLYLETWKEAAAAQLLAEADLPGPGPWVGLSPGAAYGPAKRWPPEHFAALGRELIKEFGARLVLLGGREEAPGGRPGQGAASGCRC